ncbi:hypothetical protein [Bradyrhizobium sp. AUGA SZCCT0182]|uniref:hypothetical protein n=1 Tax=Bradyrhizobium sp. AUGA SZCCT0182 TaxID=2807667 RepID=UPI001BA89348|nr:hypothetical protein [Bradyrhizobium sp. AUGA SZCCT0182]MBR1235631.1 hypothetical protein [Bradyrhizobium sp. AUGA SZCCT0182]
MTGWDWKWCRGHLGREGFDRQRHPLQLGDRYAGLLPCCRPRLRCKNLVASSADIRIARDARIDGVLSSTYNHGFIEVGRNVHARHFVIDDHTTIVRGNADARGWKDAEHVEVALPVSSWIAEVRPEFKAEFFDVDGGMTCPNGNVELVQALLGGREILRNL